MTAGLALGEGFTSKRMHLGTKASLDAAHIFGPTVMKRRQFEMIWWMTLHSNGGLKGAVIFFLLFRQQLWLPNVLPVRDLELDDSQVL